MGITGFTLFFSARCDGTRVTDSKMGSHRKGAGGMWVKHHGWMPPAPFWTASQCSLCSIVSLCVVSLARRSFSPLHSYSERKKASQMPCADMAPLRFEIGRGSITTAEAVQNQDTVLHIFWLNTTSEEYQRQKFLCLSTFQLLLYPRCSSDTKLSCHHGSKSTVPWGQTQPAPYRYLLCSVVLTCDEERKYGFLRPLKKNCILPGIFLAVSFTVLDVEVFLWGH